MCLTEKYSRFRVDKNLSDTFPIRNGLKKGDALSPLLFNFALDYIIRKVQVNHDLLKLNGTHRLLVYADVVNILGGSLHNIKENAEALIVAGKEIGLEINAVTPRRGWEDNITMDLQEVECAGMDWMEMVQDRDRLQALMNAVMKLRVPKMRGIS
jgi:hypothetical protein